ncbi:hypothetical protein HAX54_042205 [Datura stramonium]|uniref:Piwi domain-containing protein n=1 Tax=Datura stramonium TaxID=4076 RepID=A0ABS8SM87_DATST|nr:hypothetical protein [Datura stramonium]
MSNEELVDLAKAIYDDHYRPAITLVVAQKRHHTRLIPEGSPANVPPGTGRMFQEVLMEMHSSGSTTSSHAASASSSSTPSFEQRFYDLHPDLQNVMFFVLMTPQLLISFTTPTLGRRWLSTFWRYPFPNAFGLPV